MKNIKDIKSKGFLELSYPEDLRSSVLSIVDSWKDFCDLPFELKNKLSYSNKSDGVGYEYKDGNGLSKDRKENFDITLSGISWLEDNIKDLNSDKISIFIENAISLVKNSQNLIYDFAYNIEKEFSFPGFCDLVKKSKENLFFRFIHYFPNSFEGTEIAGAHVDQSGFTLHLFESHKGLECMDFNKKWIPMDVDEYKTVIIPSMQLQLYSRGYFKALAHRVVSTKETEKTGRYSTVCFVQFKDFPKYNKEKFGRLQEREPGFNYDMPYGQFSDMFKL